MFKKIVVAIDGSKVAQKALEAAMKLASTHQASLFPVYVVDYPSSYYPSVLFDVTPFQQAIVSDARKVLDNAKAQMADAGIEGDTHLVDGNGPNKTIAQHLEEAAWTLGADAVVLGTHGRRGVERMMMGSVAESFVRLSSCPVLLVPGQETPAKA